MSLLSDVGAPDDVPDDEDVAGDEPNISLAVTMPFLFVSTKRCKIA